MGADNDNMTVDDMIVEKDVALPVGDGHVLRANVFRPPGDGPWPVLMALGIYGKDVHFADGHAAQWKALKAIHPDLDQNGSSGRWLRYEQIDPERWVPEGYVVIAVDGRGSGASPGYLDPLSPRETLDYCDAIEWAARQPWSTGRVGLIGISYLAMKQWQVAALQPPHLAAIVPWEGNSDVYREWSHHGGIFGNTFPTAWMPRQVLPNQHGNGRGGRVDRDTGKPLNGPPLSDELLAGNRAPHDDDLLRHPLDDSWYRQRTADFSRITAPLLSAGNWGGVGLHLRGNIEGWQQAGSASKWLSLHIGTHFESFYLPQYVEMQRRFLDRFVKGIDNGWDETPPIRLEVRRPDGASVRFEYEWPLARTQWTKHFLDAAGSSLRTDKPEAAAEASYEALGPGVDFTTPTYAEETEYTGPMMARLWIISSTTDMDIFATLRLFDAAGEEVIFVGASEKVPVSRGWLRASHRRLDAGKSTFCRPWHRHTDVEKLVPGEAYEVEVEIWPTSIVVPKGYRLVLTIAGRDFEFPGISGRMLHDHPADRPAAEFGGRNTISDRRRDRILPVVATHSGGLTAQGGCGSPLQRCAVAAVRLSIGTGCAILTSND